MHISLQNKKALVCGSTQGIGLATAKLMAKMGASITLVARNQEKLKYRLETALRSDYNKALKERLKVRYGITQESLFF